MINHARTLLLNRTAKSRPPMGWFGEEFIPTEYIAVDDVLLPALRDLRQTLLGRDPDFVTQNYRAAQYTKLLHARPETEWYVLALDGRYTYRHDTTELLDAAFGSRVTPLGTTTMKVQVHPPYAGRDAEGINFLKLKLDYDATAQQATILDVAHQRKAVVTAAMPASGGQYRSDPIPLLDSGVTVELTRPTAPTGTTGFDLELASRPSRTLPQILAEVRDQTLERLWSGRTADGPYGAFRAMVRRPAGDDLTRLAGLLLTLIYRTDEARLGTA